jgi:hypothetical protein
MKLPIDYHRDIQRTMHSHPKLPEYYGNKESNTHPRIHTYLRPIRELVQRHPVLNFIMETERKSSFRDRAYDQTLVRRHDAADTLPPRELMTTLFQTYLEVHS